MTLYAIGDIHGQLDRLRAAHDLIARDAAANGPGPVVHLGDLVDRGPDSAGVVAFLMAGIAAGADWVVIAGNHDRMFRLFVEPALRHDPRLRHDLSWLHPRIGGAATLASYGVRAPADRPVAAVHADARAAVPAEHLAFLGGLPAFHRVHEVLCVHAGIRPGLPLAAQTEDDMLWIRHDFLDDPRDHGALIVHGHTAIDRARHYGNRLNLDSGAGYGGPLSAVAINGRAAFLLTPAGRVPLTPGT